MASVTFDNATRIYPGGTRPAVVRLSLEVADLVCAPDGHPRKPAPDMVLALLARHELGPQECLAVGDRPADVEAAAAAGVEGVLLETPGIPLEAPGARRIHSLRSPNTSGHTRRAHGR